MPSPRSLFFLHLAACVNFCLQPHHVCVGRRMPHGAGSRLREHGANTTGLRGAGTQLCSGTVWCVVTWHWPMLEIDYAVCCPYSDTVTTWHVASQQMAFRQRQGSDLRIVGVQWVQTQRQSPLYCVNKMYFAKRENVLVCQKRRCLGSWEWDACLLVAIFIMTIFINAMQYNLYCPLGKIQLLSVKQQNLKHFCVLRTSQKCSSKDGEMCFKH